MLFIFWWDFQILHTSIATSCFDHLARIIQDGRKLGKNFRTVYWEFMLVDMALSSFTIQILTLDSWVNGLLLVVSYTKYVFPIAYSESGIIKDICLSTITKHG